MNAPNGFIPPVSDRSKTKPIYLILADDPTATDGVQYYKVVSLNEGSIIDFKGYVLTKAEAAKLTKDTDAKTSSKKEPVLVQRKIPLNKIIRIDNLSYKTKTPQGE